MKRIAAIIDSNTIHVYDKTQFDWHAIRNSGQIFRDPPCEIVEEKDRIVIKAMGNKDSVWLWNYFDLDTDYSEIKKELARFKALCEPMAFGGGIRILRQPFHEVIICFIISANNNIKRFARIIEQIDFGNLKQYSEADFKKMGCGYRAPYLVKTIRLLGMINVKELSKLEDRELQKQLTALPGIGEKVSSCVALFCGDLRRLSIAPKDVWIRRAIEQLGKKQADAIMNHKYAGVAQQYIFYYMQYLKKELKEQE